MLLEAGHDLVVLDDFSNSSPESLRRVRQLANLESNSTRLQVLEGDIRSRSDLRKSFHTGKCIDAVVHFAGLKAVGESVRQPLRYWDVNVAGSQSLLSVMQEENCRTLAFSSSATLYGLPGRVPVTEGDPVQPINPYGFTKMAVEQMLEDLSNSEPGWRIARLRYFNPVGAHPSGQIGEDPNGTPNNLFPFVSQVAVGRRQELQVFGSDWPTPDGTGVRDYIHVMDLAEGHLAAIQHLLEQGPQLLTVNLGSGQGHSVLEVVKAFEKASGREVAHKLADRRPGDAPVTVADPSLANRVLGWGTRRSIEEICRDGWSWQSKNPDGYSEKKTYKDADIIKSPPEPQVAPERSKGEYILLTGATSGIGRCICLNLASRGCNLVLLARDRDKLIHLEEMLRERSIKTLSIECDLSDQASVTTACQLLISKDIALAGIISNASESLTGQFGSFSNESLRKHIQTCVGSPSIILNTLWRLLTRESYVIIIGSTCSLSAGYGTSNNSVYSASKAYLRFLSEAIRKERDNEFPRILVVHPGTVNTSFHRDSDFNPSQQKWPRVISPEKAAMKIINLIDKEKAGEAVLCLDNRAAILLWRLGLYKALHPLKGIRNVLRG